ncbi:MAG TPA: FAD-dependent oxidoreductase [Alphaproteobacteria bacterium]|jgi:glycine/D-amino acid oxidase-like deaminating enzyme
MAEDYDIAVVGGGLVGGALAWGLAGAGQRVVLLDEGDVALRAARGNFALVWVQGKGLGLPDYAAWTARSAVAWPDFAAALAFETGIDLRYRRPGGFHLALSESELERRAAMLQRLHNQAPPYQVQILARAEVARMLPAIGPDVAGASFCPLDGHADALRLFRALHAGFQRRGGRYLADRAVEAIEHRGREFRLATRQGEIRAGKVVLAAGLGNARLAPMVGLSAPVRPQRGHILVTERLAPFLHHPMATLRQTGEGGVMIGDSQEEAGFDNGVATRVVSAMAARAVRAFPLLARANVVRSWAALRVMSPDGFPIYEQSAACPGAFVVTCHSGVTLAAVHATVLAPEIAAGALAGELRVFGAKRFNVPQAA